MLSSVGPQRSALPATPGVYRFRDAGGRVLYIGRATSLRERVPSYWRDLGDRRHLARMVARVARIEAVACDSVHEGAWLERNLLQERMPRWNRTPGGEEVPAWLLLDPGPRAPGLRLVHRPTGGGRLFGPYLGGQKVRSAVSALHRLHPLAYTGTALSGAERDMAAKRGVRPELREHLVAELAAVLQREPAAVGRAREALATLRDRASQELAFERAAGIQAELKAVEWVVAAQRVTTADGGDLAIHGWADGVLVSFTVRGGRMCEWEQRRCSRAGAAARVAATPVGWAPFAQRNAELAAALSRSR